MLKGIGEILIELGFLTAEELSDYSNKAALANKSMQTAGIAQTSSGLGMLTGGMNQMAQAWNAPTNQQSSAQNIAGYGSTGASYQQSFGSDTQFGTYDSGAYQGPV